MFWNIGETYFNGEAQFAGSKHSEKIGDGLYNRLDNMNTSQQERVFKPKGDNNWLQSKQLLGLPWRFAIAMQDKGWILRNAVIWDKPNHMPSSVKDRFSNGYEYIFMFVKNRKYWFDLDSVREPHQSGIPAKFNIRVREVQKGTPEARLGSRASEDEVKNYDEKAMRDSVKRGFKSRDRDSILIANRPADYIGNVNGKNCGDVWRITTRPHPFAHFAVFPEQLAERCIKSGCPEFVCKKCGKPRERKIEIKFFQKRERLGDKGDGNIKGLTPIPHKGWESEHKTVGWSDCGCNAGFQGGVCLDPFMGSGTVAVVAKRLNRQYLGFELNQKYIDIASKRLAGLLNWEILTDIEQGKQKTLIGELQ